MGMNDFASGHKPFLSRSSFVVRNISQPNKRIHIFNYPIPFGMERDLLSIPGVGEAEIRASCLKGEIRSKILANEIIITNNTSDLVQFNDEQKTFLRNAGVSNGLDIGTAQITSELNSRVNSSGGGSSGITAAEHQTLRQAIHLIDEGPGDGFTSGAYKEIIGQPFPSSITWYIDNTKAAKIVEKLIVRDGNENPTTITWNVFMEDGIIIAHTIIDTITYTSNVFESTRTRTIS
jgi:hypothetical protein